MHITIIGSGYVGLVAGACFAQMGNNVICLDMDSQKIESLQKGQVPIYEPGLESMVRENTELGTLSFTTNKAQAIGAAEVIFIAVGTPMGDDGSADLRFVRAVAADIGTYMARKYVVVVDKSTVPVGTAKEVKVIIESNLAKRGINTLSGDESLTKGYEILNPKECSTTLSEILESKNISGQQDSKPTFNVVKECRESPKNTYPSGNNQALSAESAKTTKDTQAFDVVSNPEFLKEGVAIKDFMSPDRVVVGTDSRRALEVMKALYAPFLLKSDRFISMGIESAEMTKYAANAMLATKISFINEMSQICERVGANINDVRLGIGSDSRIGYSFIYPGCGYGGSCFPKDVRALEKTAKDYGYEAQILNAVQSVNERQKMLLVEKIVRHFGENLQGLKFALWGLSFKPETDDMREASSLVLIRELVKRGAYIQAYDPKSYHQAHFYLQDCLDSVRFETSKYDAIKNATALVLMTEWREFRSPDFDEMKKLLQAPLIFDGRNIYQHCHLEQRGFVYYQIGVGNKTI